MKRIIFLNGGYLNERGPFETGQEILVPDEQAEQLVNLGQAVLVPASYLRPVSISIAIPGADHV